MIVTGHIRHVRRHRLIVRSSLRLPTSRSLAALRAKLGLPDERFPMPAFVGMISGEIEKMRAAGHSDEATALLLSEATGAEVSAEEVERYYASPEARGPG